MAAFAFTKRAVRGQSEVFEGQYSGEDDQVLREAVVNGPREGAEQVGGLNGRGAELLESSLGRPDGEVPTVLLVPPE